jgi:hypothetical protein
MEFLPKIGLYLLSQILSLLKYEAQLVAFNYGIR